MNKFAEENWSPKKDTKVLRHNKNPTTLTAPNEEEEDHPVSLG